MAHLTKIVAVRKGVGRAAENAPDREARIALAQVRLNLNVCAAMLKGEMKGR